MKKAILIATCFAALSTFTPVAAFAQAVPVTPDQGAMKKDGIPSKEGMSSNGMSNNGMTKDGMAKDGTTGMSKDGMSKDSMAKGGMKKDGMSK